MPSSDEEELSRFSECVVNISGVIFKKDEDCPVSNRVLPEEHKQYDHKNLKVSDSLKKHVSKHLEAMLNNTKFVEIKAKKKKRKKEKPTEGLVLLSSPTGKVIVTELDSVEVCPVNRNKVNKKWISEAKLLKRAKEIAVTPEYVLSKKEVESWAPEIKGAIEIVKIKR